MTGAVSIESLVAVFDDAGVVRGGAEQAEPLLIVPAVKERDAASQQNRHEREVKADVATRETPSQDSRHLWPHSTQVNSRTS